MQIEISQIQILHFPPNLISDDPWPQYMIFESRKTLAKFEDQILQSKRYSEPLDIKF